MRNVNIQNAVFASVNTFRDRCASTDPVTAVAPTLNHSVKCILTKNSAYSQVNIYIIYFLH